MSQAEKQRRLLPVSAPHDAVAGLRRIVRELPCGQRHAPPEQRATFRTRRAFSLLEVMIVLAVIGVLLAVAIPRSEPTLVEQLRATSRIVAAELQYARSLAVGNNSTYRVAFDPSANELILTHSGTKTSLNTLPVSAFRSQRDTATAKYLSLNDLPNLSVPVRLMGATVGSGVLQSAAMVEFGPMGQTTASAPTTVWLAVSVGNQHRYATISVNPVTGLVTAGGITAGPLPGVLSVSGG